MDPDAVDRVERVPHGSSDETDVLDLSANINPEIPDGTRAVYEAALDAARSYPPEEYPEFRAAAAAYVGCERGQVVPTAGGVAGIRLAIGTTVSPGESVLLPHPSFGEYAREVKLAGGEPVFVRETDLLNRDPSEYAMVVVCTPNNPTGWLPEADRLAAFIDRCRETDTVVLIDEAFLGFTGRESMAGEGVVAVRSLTKLFGLPGLRAGFVVAEGSLSNRLRTARPPWALSAPAAAVGAHGMEDEAFVEATRRRIERERAYLRDGLESIGFDVRPSEAPFVLLDVGEPPGELLEACRRRGVVLRDATTFRGLSEHVRVAVRDRESSDRLLSVLEDIADSRR
ncbi:MAG: threonine-phosphate decarboxylase CobD [Natronomonas sp.]